MSENISHTDFMRLRQHRLGFSMIELLIAIAIVALLFLLLLAGLQSSIARAQDAREKRDLLKLKVAFEEYYNDNYCYPPAAWFDSADDCGSDQLSPYINEIPCDRSTGLPYAVDFDETGCSWFKVYGSLNYLDEALCVDTGGTDTHNYGVSSSNTAIQIDCSAFEEAIPDPSASPTSSESPSSLPSPSSSPLPSASIDPNRDYFFCQGIGNCTGYNPYVQTCEPNYNNFNCSGACTTTISNCYAN